MRGLFTTPVALFVRRWLIAALVVGLLAPHFAAQPAAAAACTVTVNTDNVASPPAGSLRQKLADATCATIGFQAGLASPITLAGSLPDITRAVAITGPGADKLTVQGNNTFPLLTINAPSLAVSIGGLTLAKGKPNANPGGNLRIVAGTIGLSSLALTGSAGGNNGAGAAIVGGAVTMTGVTISGNGTAQSGGDGLYINTSGTVSLTNSTVANNFARGLNISAGTVTVTGSTISGHTGAGISATGTFTLASSTASDNAGGGVVASGTVTITNSTISGNTSNNGGGLNVGGTVTISGSTISNNTSKFLNVYPYDYGYGGGLYQVSGTLALTNSTISGNTANQRGGGFFLKAGTATVNGSTLSGNTATNSDGGGLNSAGTVTLTDSTIVGNTADGGSGGGIFGWGGTVTVDRSTISGNSTGGSGGGIGTFTGTLAVTNSTISGNSARNTGGGIGAGLNDTATATLRFVTITGNVADSGNTGNSDAGGGISYGTGTVTALGSIVIGNRRGPTTADNCARAGAFSTGTLASQGHNLWPDPYQCAPGNDTDLDLDTLGLTVAQTLNATLADNGGPTKTHALVADSPANNHGDPAACAAAPVNGKDQRGTARPQGTGCDIGAYEGSGTSAPVPSFSPLPLPTRPTRAGTLLAWGSNNTGQLGQGSLQYTSYATPTAVPGVGNVVAVAAGGSHTLALLADGTVLSWGRDINGQLGDGTVGSPDNEPTPKAVPGLSDIVAIAAGDRVSFAIKADGSVLAWGDDAYGQLGDGTVGGPGNNPTPKVVPGLSNIVAIAANSLSVVALRTDGTVYTWGYGVAGNTTDGFSNPTPKVVPGVRAVAVAAGPLALRADGHIVVWTGTPTPHTVSGVSGIVGIATTGATTFARKGDGTVLAWGSDTQGELGDGTVGNPASNPIPTVVPGVSGIASVAAGGGFALALTTGGTIISWGNDTSKTLGHGVFGPQWDPTPKAVPDVSSVAAVAAGGTHSFALVAPLASPTPTHTLTVTGGAGGVVTGSGSYAAGSAAGATAGTGPDFLFTGWTLDGTPYGWGAAVTVTMDTNHTLVATFVAKPTFTDVPATDPAATAIANLAARGVINGCFTDPTTGAKDFCPNDPTLRHQMAALIARAMPGWASEIGMPTFGDNTDDIELMTRVATLQRHNVVRGYQADVCAERNIATPPGCYGPLDTVKYGQVMLFIARAMVEKGYWTLQADDRTVFPDQNGPVGADPATDQQTLDHRAVVTYVHYVQTVPDVADVHANFALSNGQGWGDAAPRGWFARAFWPALNQYFGSDLVP